MADRLQVDELVHSHQTSSHSKEGVRQREKKSSVCLLRLLLTLAIGVDVRIEKSEKSSSIALFFSSEVSF